MSPYWGSHERRNEANWEPFVSKDYTTMERYLTPNVYNEHNYDQDMLDDAWNNVIGMWYRYLADAGLYEVGVLCNYHGTLVWTISRPINDSLVKVFHFMPLSIDDANEIGYDPGGNYDYPNFINKWEDDEEDWWG